MGALLAKMGASSRKFWGRIKTSEVDRSEATSAPIETEEIPANKTYLPRGASEKNLRQEPPRNGNGNNHGFASEIDSNVEAGRNRQSQLYSEDSIEDLFKTNLDIDEKDETLQAMELSFKTLFHVSLDALLLVDNNTSILHANSAAHSLFGLRGADLLGRKFLNFVTTESKADAEAAWEMLLTLASHEGDLVLLNHRGKRTEIHFRGRTNLWFGVHLLVIKDLSKERNISEPAPDIIAPAPNPSL